MTVQRSRLRATDLAGLAVHGMRAHPLRAALSATGIAIGIAAMVAVLGISTSSQARVQSQLASIGTNLLTVTAGNDMFGAAVPLDAKAVPRVKRIAGVKEAAWLAALPGSVYRSGYADENASAGLQPATGSADLLKAVGARIVTGTTVIPAWSGADVVVLGATAAERLGVTETGTRILVAGRTATVVGILAPVPLAPEIDRMALLPTERATDAFGFTGAPTRIYERSADEDVNRIRALLPVTISPANTKGVQVSRPSDALAAKHAVDEAFRGLLLGIGSVALLVGAVGVANTMVVAVVERRKEIGLRRSLGATRGHIRRQFVAEAIALSAMGGIAGVVLGIVATAVVAATRGWPVALDAWVAPVAFLVTVIAGGISGVAPAMRAARTPPTAALGD